MPFLRAFARSEMQTALSKIWPRVSDSISNDNNCYVKCTSSFQVPIAIYHKL